MMSVDSFKLVRRVTFWVFLSLLLGACSTVNERVPVQDAAPPGPTPQAVEQLNRINDLQTEVRELRNQLEEQQFELENLKQRQQDLFQGLDQRLRIAENTQQGESLALINPEQPQQDTTASESTVDDQDQMTPDGMINTNDEAPADSTPSPSSEVASVDQQTLYDQGFDHLKESRYTEAISMFTQLVNQYPNGGLADDASYWIGEANYVNRQYEAAIRAFRSVVAQYPSSDRVPEALLKVGYVQYDIGDYQNAEVTFNDVLRRYTDHPVSISAKSRLERIERGISN
jgi:tol-pal system protein YbgF